MIYFHCSNCGLSFPPEKMTNPPFCPRCEHELPVKEYPDKYFGVSYYPYDESEGGRNVKTKAPDDTKLN